MATKYTNFTPEIWGGLECSYNRVRDLFMDQLLFCGHYERGEADIHLIASTGIKAIRYPIIWERHQPSPVKTIDWSWTARQLAVLQSHQIIPIAGLMHHGNGPAFTDLTSPSFADQFASYADHVARKFPWLKYYTPINEPLTTARFSGLYGIWYPHRRSDREFALILLNQMKAIVLAMKAIRKINPQAKLLQTEDLAKTYSTPLLQYQADFENERRWLTYDILCGRLKTGHPLWNYFQQLKIPEKLFYFFVDNPCPPDIIGADHYLTSERFLDENLNLYPYQKHGANHTHAYADVEAIRVNHAEPWGLEVLLQECWDRYKIPIAVTEVHINGPSHDQIRWFKEVWDTVTDLKRKGVDINAVTSWSLLGSFGWNNLLTVPNGHYEPGAFDLRSGEPEPTELSAFLKLLSQNPNHTHPALDHKGWWQDEKTRCLYNTNSACQRIDLINPLIEVDLDK
jgi:dTDP-4-dehydrorhamnose reductase